jgi:hypothetical protein
VGTVVELELSATHGTEPADVALSFQFSARAAEPVAAAPGSSLVIPSTVSTGGDGKATARLIMPDLGSGGVLLVIAAAEGAVSEPLQLTNE